MIEQQRILTRSTDK